MMCFLPQIPEEAGYSTGQIGKTRMGVLLLPGTVSEDMGGSITTDTMTINGVHGFLSSLPILIMVISQRLKEIHTQIVGNTKIQNPMRI